MAQHYEIHDAFDGRILFSSYKHPLKFIRKKAQELADEQGFDVTVINTRTNRLLDIIHPKEPADNEPACCKFATTGVDVGAES